ncbi:MAG: fumarylacetoacetate hydrolase family protein [Chloroflexi bacterium]|nr:fumarylacetoacetate hydrolase family protein [Chloroflexota bacterium]
MKLVVFNEGRPGVWTQRGIVDVSKVVLPFGGQDGMRAIIERFDELQPRLTTMAQEDAALPVESVTLKAPVPRARVLAMGGNYRENGHREPSPMWGFLKSTDSIVGSGATVVLAEVDANIFHHEAELVVVFGKAGDHIPEAQAMDYVFGFTCGVDVSARMPRPPGGGGGIDRDHMPVSAHKSYNGFSPLGPCITTRDEIGDPQNLDVKLWVSGELRPNYNTSDLAHSIAESIAWATALTPVQPGDVLFMGTNHQGLGALQDGDHVDMEISKIGRLSFDIVDPLKRRWPRGVDEVTAADIRANTGGGPGSKARPLA